MTRFQPMLTASNGMRSLLANADSRPIPNFFSLRTLLPTTGKLDVPLAATDRLWMTLKTYAAGGENEIHAHPNEDHVFIVLQGQAEFRGPKSEQKIIKRHECVLLPRGTYYSFTATGDEPLVMMRIGTSVDQAQDPLYRVDLDGELFDGYSAENKHIDPVLGDVYFE